MIEIDKYAPTSENPTSEFGFYGSDGVGTFTIVVHNNGPTPLTNVTVTDELLDRRRQDGGVREGDRGPCHRRDRLVLVHNRRPGPTRPASIYDNEATVVGFGPNDQRVTDTDPATVSPRQGHHGDDGATNGRPQGSRDDAATTTTSASTETLPVTGASTEQIRGLGITGIALVLAGIVALGGATLVGQYRKEN